jgi:hypothetical protein
MVGVRPGVGGHEVGMGAPGAGDEHIAAVAPCRPLAVQVGPVADLDQVVALVDDRLGGLGPQRVGDPGGQQAPVE